ncbi:Cysteine-rich CPXCG [Nonlabens sp. Hel1_33_55]|nr:Cysteine-rich CPXCG [Nonlabens sp. Hel1_33_55]
MLLDPAYSQTYVEDCEVCCNPIEVSVSFDDGELMSFEASEIGQ